MPNRTQYNFLRLCKLGEEKIDQSFKHDNDLSDDYFSQVKTKYGKSYEDSYTRRKFFCYLKKRTEFHDLIHNDDIGKYFYYWIYSDLSDKDKNYDVALNLYTYFLKAYSAYAPGPDICRIDMYGDKANILKRSAILIELNDTLNEIFNNDSKEPNCSSVIQFSKLYSQHVEECHNNYDHHFCGELQKFKQKYDEKMRTIEDCDAPSILPSAIKHDLLGTIMKAVITLAAFSYSLFLLYKVK
ncbi:hypothetical protein C922_05442 [Plasmodium inui San Antonio 1]|uniref:Uncharacterized protein n=1 Tax=Plasmodium inui San Antonio 1 TaxID=1237626 RepID=W6ZY21_9APIC|nr:hypothetical protein C922_05442 [Plasmodium inui San Antonio 1]EUD64175.1 hypothetical protein C922_05442 [Plasmodium inui San Antonio 1]